MITIDYNKCKACGSCIDFCPVNAISMVDDVVTISEMPCKSPCKDECPIHMNIPGYLYYISEGNFKEAYNIIRETTPLPAICGRVCNHPCEEACNRSLIDQPLAIASLKRFVSDQVDIEKLEIPQIERNGKKVAIVGSGPAGLAAAHDLALLGYGVTIVEALPEPGGMLRVSIPDHRLPKDIVRKEINYIERLGVEIKTNSKVGGQIALDELSKSYDSVFIATGAHKELKLGIPGEQMPGVIYALDLLHAVNMGKNVEVGNRVVVIGGGNSAIDAARVSRRLGGKVTIIYRRSRSEMPVNSAEVELAEKEGIEIVLLAAPTRIIAVDDKISKIECAKMMLGPPDESGRPSSTPVKGSAFTIDADTIIAALGQAPDIEFTKELNLEISYSGTIIVDEVTLSTDIKGIFAGGDAVKGPSSVIDAIADGKRAAYSIDCYLRGEAMPSHEEKGTIGKLSEEETAVFKNLLPYRQRVEILELAPGERIKDFSEVMQGYTIDQACEEAKRCLKSCINCEVCMNICSAKAISMG